jgi:hypothetical protein
LQEWEVWSLDVSTAFLQGWTFSEMRDAGCQRQPCALVLPKDVWLFLLRCDPTNKYYKAACNDPELHCLMSDKAAYGLKDAPLLWNLRAVLVLTGELGFTRSSHDVCLFYLVEHGKVVLVISLHVDDTLATGTVAALTKLHMELEARFGKMKAEKNDFRHFGVDIKRDSITHDVTMDQTEYIKKLSPIERRKEKGRTVESDANPLEVTEFRSLVSGMAWVGITSPGAQAVASLLQGFVPGTKLKHLDFVNAALAQLRDEYVPHTFKAGFSLSSSKLLVKTDSSLGNTSGKYSQGGYLVFLCEDSPSKLGGHVCLIMFRGAKSKRVANSTMAAEALAKIQGIEAATHLQTWLLELQTPSLTAKQLINTPGKELIPIESCMDCDDLSAILLNPAQPNLTNLTMTLHISSLRADRANGKIRAWVWVDTEDMLANCQTKLNIDGTIPQDDLQTVLRSCWWQPKYLFKYNGMTVAGRTSKGEQQQHSSCFIEEMD